MRRVDRLRRELLAACDMLEAVIGESLDGVRDRRSAVLAVRRANLRRWRAMATPRPKPARKREMTAELRADLAEARRRKQGRLSEVQRQRAAAEAQIQWWNERYPVGTAVEVTRDNGTTQQTRTRSAAWLLCDHASVLLEGISGGYLLERVRALADPAGWC